MAGLSFLPWVRQGVAATIAAPDSLGPDQPAAVGLQATLTVNGAQSATVPLQVRGPADVIGIDPNEVVRVEPLPDTTNFEPNHFAYIDFDRPDFPWLFTPASAGVNSRLRPWLCLVVVRAQDGVSLLGPGAGPLPVLQIGPPARPADELPDPAESWAWAHAQVASGDSTPTDVQQALGGDPALALSRLICPRLLAPDTTYLACVVPTFEVGRRTGLGQTVQPADVSAPQALAPAWTLQPAPPTLVQVPVYYHWTFRTGDGGDFASLVQLLRVQPFPDGLGQRPIDISQPGFRVTPVLPAGSTVQVEGALQPMATPDSTGAWSGSVATAFQAALAPIVNAPGLQQTADPAADPLLAPPLYGHWYAARPTVTPGGTTWLDQLNLDPRYRSVAAFGTSVVQQEQEALVAAAWEQAADLERANQRLRQLQVSLAVNTSLHTRYFQPLGDEAVLRVASPALPRLRAATPGGATPTLTMVAQLGRSPLPLQAVSPVMRRLGRQQGPVTQRFAAQGATRSAGATWIARLNSGLAPVVVAPRYQLTTIGLIRQRLPPTISLRGYSEVTAATVAAVPPLPLFQVVPEGAPVPVTPPPPGSLHGTDSPAASRFRAAASTHLTRLNPGRLAIIVDPVHQLPLDNVRTTILDQLQPRATLARLARAVVATGPTATPPVDTSAAAGPDVQTVMAAPTFAQPMYAPLRDISPALLLPGLDTVDPNRVVGLKTNRRFVDSYMVGLNVEMGRELLWRGFPTDQRGTYFDQFWGAAADDQPRPDIAPIATWGTRQLGGTQAAPAREQFVMLLRSDLLRRYPNAVIYATKAVSANGRRAPSTNPADEVYPIFRGSLPPDVTFFGFDLDVPTVVGDSANPGYYVVIQEHAGEPKFGLDVGSAPPGATHLSVTAPPPAGLSLNGLQWGRNAAHLAGIVRRKPVRIAIHGSQLLAPA